MYLSLMSSVIPMRLPLKFTTFLGIMAFYASLSYILFPMAFYFLVEKSLESAGNGFIVGNVVSVILWYLFGRKMIR